METIATCIVQLHDVRDSHPGGEFYGSRLHYFVASDYCERDEHNKPARHQMSDTIIKDLSDTIKDTHQPVAPDKSFSDRGKDKPWKAQRCALKVYIATRATLAVLNFNDASLTTQNETRRKQSRPRTSFVDTTKHLKREHYC